MLSVSLADWSRENRIAVGLSLVKLYLSASRFSSALEAAGAVAVLLMAFYYLGQIFVLGAVVIRVLASLSGSKIVARDDMENAGSPQFGGRK